jgi:hypothetical protein
MNELKYRFCLFAAVIFAAVVFAAVCPGAAMADADSPDFGPNVMVFDPSMKDIQARLNGVYAKQERGQFNSNRYALLFKPGHYDLDVQIGFYTQALGLGRSPDDVDITGAVRSMAGWKHGDALVNFWRGAENLSVTPTLGHENDVWAVSQGTALRRIHVRGNLHLWDGGYSSGGFLADSRIDGQVVSGSQQQWLSRNCQWGRWDGGVWNMVFVGCENPPFGEWPDRPYTVIEKTPLIREKPYLVIDDAGRYSLRVPALNRASQGTTWGNGRTPGADVPLDQFYIARADRDDAASLNAALASGKNLLFAPGIYELRSSLHVTRPDTIVLGLGFTTLVADGGNPAIETDDVDGVKIAGLILEAGPQGSPALLLVGPAGSNRSHANDPSCLYDVHCRAGGAQPGQTSTFITINSSDVIGDNAWLWRADHGKGARWDVNKVANGLVVNGSNVTFYGLFVEHCQEYQTLWNGNGGRLYFYQSEMPYDPPSQAKWSHDGVDGYASYKVAAGVTSHEAWGLGVYCVFNAAPVVANAAVEAPVGPGIVIHHIITTRFGGKPGSGILHVMNDQGGPALGSSGNLN